MPLYAFYPCKADGSSGTFVTCELADDAEAHIRALRILDQHAGAASVVVWQGERKAITRARVPPDLAAVLSRS